VIFWKSKTFTSDKSHYIFPGTLETLWYITVFQKDKILPDYYYQSNTIYKLFIKRQYFYFNPN